MPTCQIIHFIWCNKSFPGLKITSTVSVGSRCSRDKQEPKLYLAANSVDPGSVPLALQSQTLVREWLVSPVMLIMSVCQLSLGQYGHSVPDVNLPQHVASFVAAFHACLTSLMF